jgi:hypothetical protein
MKSGDVRLFSIFFFFFKRERERERRVYIVCKYYMVRAALWHLHWAGPVSPGYRVKKGVTAEQGYCYCVIVGYLKGAIRGQIEES